jgi:hypothetical protein
MKRITVRRLRRDDGVALIAAIVVTLVLTGLVAIALSLGRHSDTASTGDRNSEVALSAAEAGVDEAIARIQAAGGISPAAFTGGSGNLTYSATVTKGPGAKFVIVSTGTAGTPGKQLVRKRKVRVTLEPPRSFDYVIFSQTDLFVKNNSTVGGNVWANQSITVEQNTTITGDVTSALSWLDVGSNAEIRGDVRTGGSKPVASYAINLDTNSKITRSAKASSSTGCPPTDPAELYNVTTATGSSITQDLTTIGQKVGPGTTGSYAPLTCTDAPPAQPLPPFTFNQNNYDSASFHSFSSVSDFQTWFSSNKTNFKGTFYVSERSPSQANRIDLGGGVVMGDVTMYTAAPVFTNGISDSGTSQKVFVLISTYNPPAGTQCTSQDDSECAIHIKNNFDPSCKTAVLLYSSPGPAAVKNSATYCGSIYSENVSFKNNPNLVYDDRVARIVGFGPQTYVRTRYEELTP